MTAGTTSEWRLSSTPTLNRRFGSFFLSRAGAKSQLRSQFHLLLLYGTELIGHGYHG